jgi:glycosyltransferase involved in cell wall biosynthesis
MLGSQYKRFIDSLAIIMKILFFITSWGHGRGGHLFSLDHISREIGKKTEVKIISIGRGASDVVSKNTHFLAHIQFNGLSLLWLNGEIKKLAGDYEPDIIHCFDAACYGVLRMLPALKKHVFVLNKCGGPNPILYPQLENLVVFSKENLAWFESQPKFKDANIRLIPNRVSPLTAKSDPDCPKAQGCFTIVKVNRINSVYENDVLDSIRLVEYLKKHGCSIKLIIIGVVEDAIVYDGLRTKTKAGMLPVTFLTKDKYTQNASDYLYLADAVIGTGRGFMEAASLGIPLLTPVCNYEYPLLVDETNFEGLFETNFSPRNRASQSDISDNLLKVQRLITDTDYYQAQKDFSVSIFKRHFNVQGTASSYLELYNTAMLHGRKSKIFAEPLVKARNLYNIWRRYR